MELQKFKAPNKEENTDKTTRDSLDLDPDQFSTALKNAEAPEGHEAWKMYDCVDKPEGDPVNQKSNIRELAEELRKLLQQNQDISVGLSKVETLLSVQTEVERENRKYKEEERQRSRAVANGIARKEKIMRSELDRQRQEVEELEKKIATAKKKLSIPLKENDRDLIIDETGEEPGDDQTALDVKIISANLKEDQILYMLSKQYPGRKWETLNVTQTLVSLGFMKHAKESTAPRPGAQPVYGSQMTFIDTVSEEYVNYMASIEQQLELWLHERGDRTVPLGRATILLSDFVTDTGASFKQGPKAKYELKIEPNPALL